MKVENVASEHPDYRHQSDYCFSCGNDFEDCECSPKKPKYIETEEDKAERLELQRMFEEC